MDSDVFVSRALDTVAEEMTQTNVRTNLPFEIEYQNENNKEVPASITMTVRAALRHWCEIQNLNTNLYDIARTTVKFGDCFFQKQSDFKRWKYIDPGDIIGITIDENGVPEHYHVRTGEKNRQGAFGDITIVPAEGIVHFTLSSSMGENGPFGESPLWACVKAFRHLSLLEDSVIIYRIVRAPERRVFFLDVGNMPPQRVKAYMESVRNELKQKRIPNETGGSDKIDSVYNPMCLTLDTRIPLLDGRTLELNQLIVEHEAGKQNWAYSTDPTTGSVVPGLISWAGVTRREAEVVKITLDNGKVITCTPDHKFPVLGKGFVEAEKLTASDSLISFETDQKSLSHDKDRSYTRVFDHEQNEFVMVHRLVAEYFRDMNKHQELTFSPEFDGAPKAEVHHKNYDRYNNSPQNLVWMNHRDHFLYHSQVKKEYWEMLSTEESSRIKNKISNSLKAYYSELTLEQREELSAASSTKWKRSIANLKSTDPEKYAKWRVTLGEIRKARIEEDIFFKEQLAKNFYKKFAGTQQLKVSRDTLGELVTIIKTVGTNRNKVIIAANTSEKFLSLLRTDNQDAASVPGEVKVYTNKFSGKLTDKGLKCIYQTFGYKNWKHLVETVDHYNHRIVSIEKLDQKVDTGCITIDGEHKYHDHHTFALEAGVFTQNSMNEDYFFAQTADGRGSRVETLSGGENLGEITDLTYFQNKFLQGLRIPASYMKGGQDGTAQITDGKVGVAYIEEVRFANYVSRLQQKINKTFDAHFKAYLKSAGIKIDPHLFRIRLCDPANFKEYKQAEVDEKMISNFSNVKDVAFLSARYKMMHYLGMSEDDIQENQAMLKQELGIPDNGIDETLTDLRMMYDPQWIENRPEIKVPEDFDDHTGGAEEETEVAPEGEEEKAGKEAVASSGKEAKTEPEEAGGKEEGEAKSVEALKKEVTK
jgi:hypothetical protein